MYSLKKVPPTKLFQSLTVEGIYPASGHVKGVMEDAGAIFPHGCYHFWKSRTIQKKLNVGWRRWSAVVEDEAGHRGRNRLAVFISEVLHPLPGCFKGWTRS